MVNLLDKSASENASSLNVSGSAQYSERFRLLCHGVSHKEPIVINCATAERQFNGTKWGRIITHLVNRNGIKRYILKKQTLTAVFQLVYRLVKNGRLKVAKTRPVAVVFWPRLWCRDHVWFVWPGGRGCLMSPPVWNLRAVISFHFAISSLLLLLLLPSPVTLSILSFSACWSFLLNFFQQILQYFS